jgi:hypothetical protein
VRWAVPQHDMLEGCVNEHVARSHGSVTRVRYGYSTIIPLRSTSSSFCEKQTTTSWWTGPLPLERRLPDPGPADRHASPVTSLSAGLECV